MMMRVAIIRIIPALLIGRSATFQKSYFHLKSLCIQDPKRKFSSTSQLLRLNTKANSELKL